MLPGALLSGDLDASMIAEHLTRREHWLKVAQTHPDLQRQMDLLVARIEDGDPTILARLEKHPELGGRLFALAPALPMLRIFNVLEQRDDAYLAKAVASAPALSNGVPVSMLAQARMGFLRMLNTLARVLARRVEVPNVRIPVGV